MLSRGTANALIRPRILQVLSQASDQDGAALVALPEDLEEQFRSGGGQGDEAQCVDDQQAEAGQIPLQVEPPPLVPGFQRSALPRRHGRDAPARFPSRCTSLPWRCWTTGSAAWSRSLERQPASPHPAALAGNSPVYGHLPWLIVNQSGTTSRVGMFPIHYSCGFHPFL